MVAYILAGIVAVITLMVAMVIAVANSFSDAPTQKPTPVWPTFLIGGIIIGLLIGSHFLHLSW